MADLISPLCHQFIVSSGMRIRILSHQRPRSNIRIGHRVSNIHYSLRCLCDFFMFFFIIMSWLMIVIPFFMWKKKHLLVLFYPWPSALSFYQGIWLVLSLGAFCNILKHAICFYSKVLWAPRPSPMAGEHPSLPYIFASEDPLCHAYKDVGNISSNLVDMHCSFRVM